CSRATGAHDFLPAAYLCTLRALGPGLRRKGVAPIAGSSPQMRRPAGMCPAAPHRAPPIALAGHLTHPGARVHVAVHKPARGRWQSWRGAMDWTRYQTPSYDELIGPDGLPRPAARPLVEYLSGMSAPELAERQQAADVAARVMGITFTVYSDGRNVDRPLPCDLIPRIIDSREWQRTEAGLRQRMQALNLFIGDIYGAQKIVRDKVFPAELLAHSVNFRPQCVGVRPPLDVWAHICGSDLVRDADGTLYALEDNLRIPSGVSYMLENRMVAKRVFPELFETSAILPVDDYPAQLYDTLAALSPRPGDSPVIALLTPGVFNSAYFEHAYLAQAMGIELVEGGDLFVAADDCTYMRTVYGPRRVDVVYR